MYARDDPQGGGTQTGATDRGRQLPRWQRKDLSNMSGENFPHILKEEFPSFPFLVVIGVK